jgi:hypothetical protein
MFFATTCQIISKRPTPTKARSAVKAMSKTKTNRILALRIPCPYYLVELEPPVKSVDSSDEQRRQKAIDEFRRSHVHDAESGKIVE